MDSKKEKKTGRQIQLDKELASADAIIRAEVCDLIHNTSKAELSDEAKTTKKISDIIIGNVAYIVKEYSLKRRNIRAIHDFFDKMTTDTKPDEDGVINLSGELSVVSEIRHQNGFSEKDIDQPDVWFKDASELSKQRIVNLYITNRHNNFRLFIIPIVLSIIAIIVSILSIILGAGASPK